MSRSSSSSGNGLLPPILAGILFCIFGLVQAAAAGKVDISPEAREFFERNIRPALAENCFVCHRADLAQGELRLDSPDGWEKGGKSGPAIIPGDPEASLLIRAIRHQGPGLPMPLGGEQLSAELIDVFERWVRLGAAAPGDSTGPEAAAADETHTDWEQVYRDRSGWWSLQPVSKPAVPEVRREEWSDQPVDRFLLAKLEANGLTPAPRADRHTLLRRVSYLLTGLPPKPEEVAAFLRNPDPDAAYAQEVDRLLDSSHFGEEWARHWMDVVRYSDTYGYETDAEIKGSWRYRNYLIRAFNSDIPFDQLVREHIAGDLLSQPRVDAARQINESMIGPTWFQMGENRHGDSLMFNGIHQEMLDNKVDTFSKAFQATTVACARCHNHKYDAIAQQDYYALGGVFMSSRWVTHTLDLPERNRKVLEELAALKTTLRKPLADWWLEAARQIPRYLMAAQAVVEGRMDAAEAAQDLDRARLAVWEEAISPRPFEGQTTKEDEEEAAESAARDTMSSPLFPWLEIQESLIEGEQLEMAWRKLAGEYSQARRERIENNARDFSLAADFGRRDLPEGWSVDGVGVRHGWVENGDFTVALEGSGAVEMLLPAGLFTHALSPRLNGAVRTPFLNHSGRSYLSMEVIGGDYSAQRLIVDNSFRTERQTYLKDHRPHWIRHSNTADARTNRSPGQDESAETRIYIELATKASNPNFPPRVGLGPDVSAAEARDARSWFGVTRVFLHDKKESPADELGRFTSLFAADAPVDLPQLSARYGEWIAASVEDWAEGRADEEDVLLINWMLEAGLVPNHLLPGNMLARKEIWELVASYREAEEKLVDPVTVLSMADLDPGRDYRLNVRGVYTDYGERVPRGHIRVLSGPSNGSDPKGSGRLDLAQLIASSENPLTARVFVNRVWHWVFGSGIVRTPDDFGHLGDRPSHPELLDYLADRFVQEGWSVKKLVRMLVMTQVFQQSNQASGRAREVDPTNRMLHHFPLRRLDAESIRDAMLVVSGRLDRQLLGGFVDPYRPKSKVVKADQTYFSGPLDGNGRRSIYLRNTIMEPYKFLETFNKPIPKMPTGRRDVTNVPNQALTMLNDPFVAGQAEFWARQLIAKSHDSPEQRLTVMFRHALGREPEAGELTRWTQAVHDFNSLHQSRSDGSQSSEDLLQSVAVWKDTAHALFNTTEFIYVR